jgi:hypothetical protein
MRRQPHQRLLELGADAFEHVSGSLAQHLRRTETLLRSWGNGEALCLAGLYHAVYGTAGIRGSLVNLDARGAIADIIGGEAEKIAYLYGACDRARFHPRIGTSEQLQFVDRFSASEYSITESALRDFCEITLANELELAIGSESFRLEYGAELTEFFGRMQGLVSEAAFEAFRRTLRQGA